MEEREAADGHACFKQLVVKTIRRKWNNLNVVKTCITSYYINQRTLKLSVIEYVEIPQDGGVYISILYDCYDNYPNGSFI